MSRLQGPLAVFFSQYPDFQYDPAESAAGEFRRLCTLKGWGRDERELPREQYRSALIAQFNLNYGTDVNALQSWHLLCTYIGITPVPDTLYACKMAVKSAHVNLVDLVDVFGTDRRVPVFGTVQELAQYTKETEKYFPHNRVGVGALLEYLLRPIDNPSAGQIWRLEGEDFARMIESMAASFKAQDRQCMEALRRMKAKR
ncbi:hypothetical protein HYPSUDRAFT_80079 [Hypholoma sublateritium FD-334 SS-4]|uniref:Uncharacterized protein n=1 Tax=Hypholoma sublateritium (strain FD-334 SS-4) TaxID=945553 RepID=A0A0D2P7L0_HYPSF|nr:hypothetical protein HYPSUDRAFT_80079 [Hypholoma sublateritium FD-334 SS-4]